MTHLGDVRIAAPVGRSARYLRFRTFASPPGTLCLVWWRSRWGVAPLATGGCPRWAMGILMCSGLGSGTWLPSKATRAATVQGDHSACRLPVRPSLAGCWRPKATMSIPESMRESSTPRVRLAEPGESRTMAALLAGAFDQDPAFTFMFPPETSRRQKRMTRMFGIDVVRSQRLGGAWIVDDGSAAAVWYPPGQWEPSDREMLRQLPQWIAVYGRSLPAATRVLNALQEHHRRLDLDPHWYLYYMGTSADRRSNGVGSALLQAVLKRSDSEHTPAYLEATSERNRALYERHGFETRDEIALHGGGPTMYPMWRSPR